MYLHQNNTNLSYLQRFQCQVADHLTHGINGFEGSYVLLTRCRAHGQLIANGLVCVVEAVPCDVEVRVTRLVVDVFRKL